jgi:murein DD-endopeptidase MepM/ murein hydrolase activator NlpD
MLKTSSRYVGAAALGFLSLPALAAPQFLNFPVKDYSPYTPRLMSSVLDHEVPHDLQGDSKTGELPIELATTKGPYGHSGGVLSFTGELFLASNKYPRNNYACYAKPSNAHQTSTWRTVLANAYDGTAGCRRDVALNYDNHPGYDYLIPRGREVRPAFDGHIVFTKCIRTFANKNSCEYSGAIAVDHKNGFITQYLHMSDLNYGKAAKGENQTVTASWILGKVSDKGVKGVHLHFEVLQRKVNPPKKDYYDRANYMIVDPYGYRSASYYASKLLSNPGCLWKSGCQ